MQEMYDLTFRIKRYNPEEKRSWMQEYRVQAGRILRFTDVLRKINNEIDPTLAWNSSCEHAQCGTCSVLVNGKPLLACELLVENAVAQFGTTTFTIKPISIAPLVRDLIVDLEKAYARVESVKPYIITPAENRTRAGNTKFPRKCWMNTWRQPGASTASAVLRHVSAAIRTSWGPTPSWPA